MANLSFRIRCNGKLHGIKWVRGRLVLVDHYGPEYKAARAAQALGASCKCLDVLDTWRSTGAKSSDLPQELRRALVLMRAAQSNRSSERRYRRPDASCRLHEIFAKQRHDDDKKNDLASWERQNFREVTKRWRKPIQEEIVERLIAKQFDWLTTPDANGKYAGVGVNHIHLDKDGNMLRKTPWVGRRDTNDDDIRVYIPEAWGPRVYAPGFSTLDGHTILDISGFAPDGRTVVVAARGIRGTGGIWEQHAYVNPDVTLEFFTGPLPKLRPYKPVIPRPEDDEP